MTRYARRSRLAWLAALVSGSATFVVVALVFVAVALGCYFAPGPGLPGKADQVTVILRKGAGVAEVAGDLQRAHVIANAPIFMALAEVTGAARRLKPGEYAFASHSSVSKVLFKLRTGDIVSIDVDARSIRMEVSDEELARRRAAWTPPEPHFERGYGWVFTKHIEQADKGCDFDFLRTGFGAPVREPAIY